LTIEDDGREFEIAEGNKTEGRGLANMRARASLIDAQVSWSRREGSGTVFTLSKEARDATSNVQ
jgi:signal transduction histidine kinase